jgi:hypothetical protein
MLVKYINMFFTYKFLNYNLDSFIFIIFVLINLSNIYYNLHIKNKKNKNKKVRFNLSNLKYNEKILNSIKSLKNVDLIIQQQNVIYYIKHHDSDDDFGHFCDIDYIVSDEFIPEMEPDYKVY